MIEHCKNHEQYLYHYTTAEIALQHILPQRRLRLSRYTKTNDPKESKNWTFDLGTNFGRDLGKYDKARLSEWLSAELKSRTRLLCFATDRGPLTGNHLQEIFQRGYCKPRMWSHYAGSHSGVCLVFDKQILMKQFRNQIGPTCLFAANPVTYVDRGIDRDLFADQQFLINVDALEEHGRDAYPEMHLRTHVQRLFFEKMMDWRDESEWRIVAFSRTTEDLFLSIGSALSAVVFGEDTTESTIQAVIGQTADRGTQHLGLKWKNCSPWYDYKNLT